MRFDVPAAVVAGRCLLEAIDAVERSAVEELLDPRPLVLVEDTQVPRQNELVAAAVAPALVGAFEEGREVIVDAAWYRPHAVAERTCHAQLGDDRLADECALVRQLVEEV